MLFLYDVTLMWLDIAVTIKKFEDLNISYPWERQVRIITCTEKKISGTQFGGSWINPGLLKYTLCAFFAAGCQDDLYVIVKNMGCLPDVCKIFYVMESRAECQIWYLKINLTDVGSISSFFWGIFQNPKLQRAVPDCFW